MRLFIPLVLVSALAASCGSSRLATDTAAPNSTSAASASTETAVGAAPQLSDKAPAFNPNQTEVARPAGEGSDAVRTLQIAETK